MKKVSSLALIAVGLTAFNANAQTPEGPYVAIQGGVNWNASQTLKGDDNAGVYQKGKLHTSMGYAVGGSAGYSFGDVFGSVVSPRMEVEMTWRSNNAGSWKGAGNRERGLGNLDQLTFMVNGLFDFDTGTAFYPYVGAGVGGALLWLDTPSGYSNVSDMAFAYQGIAGVGYNVTDNLGVTVDYRFLGTTAAKEGGLRYSGALNHTAMVGLRYAFGAPQTVTRVIEEEVFVTADSYMVFFDFDSSRVTPEAAGIISTAASAAKSNGTTTIEVTGYTDRSGSAQYNMGLSLRRAEAVTAQLERNGIPRSMIAVYGKGESDPLVPTPDGVREPQNRRVVIVLN